jgi:hypothetical protein
MIKITDLKVPLTYDLKVLEDIVAKRLNIERSRIEHIDISKRSVNALNKQDIHFKMTLIVCVSGDENEVISQNRDKCISKEIELFYNIPKKKELKERPIVVGCGPAGMFASLILAEAGARPILLERGLDVDSRRESVLKFWRTGVLDINSNVQFGEGGAGAFSDGKLKTLISVKTGTISNGGTIPQTAGYTNYIYFVSINNLKYGDNVSGGFSTFPIKCSVDQSTRVVTCVCECYNYSTQAYQYGTANYTEIAW